MNPYPTIGMIARGDYAFINIIKQYKMKRFPKKLSNPHGAPAILETNCVLVSFKKAVKSEEVSSLAEEINLVIESPQASAENKEVDVRWDTINHTDQRYWLRTKDGKAISNQRFDEIEKYFGNKIDWIGPVYRNEDENDELNCYCPIPNVILVMKGKVSNPQALAKELNLKLDEEKSKYLPSFYYLQIKDLKKANAYELKKQLEESGNEVLLENMPMKKPLTVIPNDTLWGNQWDMVQINAPNGWDISTGDNSVTICILDEGCDLTHPDLTYSGPGINLNTMLPPGAPTGPHGTACAGIAAGTFNNAQGVSGVAGNCRVLPVAFQFWTDVECAMGLVYATVNGADVVSMSFGVYNGWGWNFALIDPAIQNAIDNDVVLVAATGNENLGTVNRYPSRNPLVIAVGGSSTDDNRKSPTSPDGEFWWGANFGSQIYSGVISGVSVVAPCVLCPTTDIQGGSGYGGGDYINDFNGTSSATPHVAGLAGLLKSKYPSLSNIEIRNVIELSAAKVGAIPYAPQPGFPNGTRNQEMGYGRIDVAAALKLAGTSVSCRAVKANANTELEKLAVGKFNHLNSFNHCPDFLSFIKPNDDNQESCQTIQVPDFKPCFYLHWGDSNQDQIETEDFEVLVLSVCNPYTNVLFKDIKISGIEVIHPNGTKAELLPDGTPSAMVVPSRLITFCELYPCSCCHIELVLKTSGALQGPYKIVFDYCIDETCLIDDDLAKGKDKVDFDIRLVKS